MGISTGCFTCRPSFGLQCLCCMPEMKHHHVEPYSACGLLSPKRCSPCTFTTTPDILRSGILADILFADGGRPPFPSLPPTTHYHPMGRQLLCNARRHAVQDSLVYKFCQPQLRQVCFGRSVFELRLQPLETSDTTQCSTTRSNLVSIN